MMISISLLVLVFTLLLLMVVFLYKSFSSSKHSRLPPSPPGLPIIGNFHQIGGLPHRSLRSLARRYGHVMLLRFGSVPTVVVSSVVAAEEVMKTHDLSFASRSPSTMAGILLYGCRNITFAPYGEYWRQMRKITVLHLLNFKRVQSFRHIKEEEVASMVRQIRSAAGGRVNLRKILITLTNNILFRVALGRKYISDEERSNKYGELVAELMHLIGEFPIGDYIPWLAWVDNVSGLLRRARRTAIQLDIFMEQVIDYHLQNQETPASASASDDVKGLVGILLSLDKESSLGISITRDSIKATLQDMLAGGTHTTSTTMDWIMVELIRHPAILKKVQEEVRKNMGRKTLITDEDISKMVYFKAVIKETLRLHPALPLLLPREAIENSKLCGYDVPAKTRLIVNAWAIARDPKYWDKPDEFNPERFIDNPVDYKGLDFQYIPFGAGRRGCPGYPFAVLTIELALANLLYHFDWEMPDGLKGEEMDMTEESGIAVQRKLDLVLLATPHEF